MLDVSGEPVVAAVLPFPLYRDLHDGDTGPDVAAVNAFLGRQGFDASPSDTVDSAFEAGVREFLKKLDYPDLAATVTPAPDTSASPPAPGTGTGNGEIDHMVFARRWIVQLDRSNRKISAMNVHIGSVLGTTDTVIANLDVTSSSVRSYLDAEALKHVKVSDKAIATDESGSRQIQLVVSQVDTSDTIDPATNAPGRAVTLAATVPSQLAGVTGELTVHLAIALSVKPELVAPISAVRTTTAGDSSVILVDPRANQVTVPIKVGTCSDGWCEVASTTTPLRAGQAVVVSGTGS